MDGPVEIAPLLGQPGTKKRLSVWLRFLGDPPFQGAYVRLTISSLVEIEANAVIGPRRIEQGGGNRTHRYGDTGKHPTARGGHEPHTRRFTGPDMH